MPLSKSGPRTEAAGLGDYAPDENDQFDPDDPDETPSLAGIVGSGWDDLRKSRARTAAANSSYMNEVRLGEEEQLVYFFDSVPFATYEEHWVERKGKKSFLCIAAAQACPLCDVGHAPRSKAAWNVLNFTPTAENATGPRVEALVGGPMLQDLLEKTDKGGRTGPLADNFYAVKRTGTFNSTQYHVTPVKVRDLADDWGLDPADAKARVEAATLYTAEDVSVPSLKSLREVAAEIVRGA